MSFEIRALLHDGNLSADYVRKLPGKEKGGAFLRVLPKRGGGSVLIVTVQAPLSGTREQRVATIRRELARLVELAHR